MRPITRTITAVLAAVLAVGIAAPVATAGEQDVPDAQLTHVAVFNEDAEVSKLGPVELGLQVWRDPQMTSPRVNLIFAGTGMGSATPLLTDGRVTEHGSVFVRSLYATDDGWSDYSGWVAAEGINVVPTARDIVEAGGPEVFLPSDTQVAVLPVQLDLTAYATSSPAGRTFEVLFDALGDAVAPTAPAGTYRVGETINGQVPLINGDDLFAGWVSVADIRPVDDESNPPEEYELTYRVEFAPTDRRCEVPLRPGTFDSRTASTECWLIFEDAAMTTPLGDGAFGSLDRLVSLTNGKVSRHGSIYVMGGWVSVDDVLVVWPYHEEGTPIAGPILEDGARRAIVTNDLQAWAIPAQDRRAELDVNVEMNDPDRDTFGVWVGNRTFNGMRPVWINSSSDELFSDFRDDATVANELRAGTGWTDKTGFVRDQNFSALGPDQADVTFAGLAEIAWDSIMWIPADADLDFADETLASDGVTVTTDGGVTVVHASDETPDGASATPSDATRVDDGNGAPTALIGVLVAVVLGIVGLFALAVTRRLRGLDPAERKAAIASTTRDVVESALAGIGGFFMGRFKRDTK